MIRMRDKNLDLFNFEREVDKFVSRKLTISKSLRTAVAISPTRTDTTLQELKLNYPTKFQEIRGLIIVHYYLPEELRWKIWLDMTDRSFSEFNKKQRVELKVLLNSKESCLSYLYFSQRFTANDLFGNMIKVGLDSLSKIEPKWKSTKVRKKVYRRGYDDQGSLRSLDKWLPDSDYLLTTLQNKKEKENYLLDKTIQRILVILRELRRKEKSKLLDSELRDLLVNDQ